MGIEPKVVTIVPPRQRITEWEQNERQRIQATLTEDAVAAMVADHPFLLVRTLERLRMSAQSNTEAQRRVTARRLTETAHATAPDTPVLADSDAWPLNLDAPGL